MLHAQSCILVLYVNYEDKKKVTTFSLTSISISMICGLVENVIMQTCLHYSIAALSVAVSRVWLLAQLSDSHHESSHT